MSARRWWAEGGGHVHASENERDGEGIMFVSESE